MLFEKEKLVSKQEVLEGVEKMNSFGVRTTGSGAQRDFVSYLKNEIQKMGLDTYSDLYSFNRWKERSSSLVLHSYGKDEEIEVTSAWPYSGETGPLGVTAEVVEIFGKHLNYLPAAGKIALVKVHDLGKIPSGIAFNQRRAFPEGLHVPEYYKGPVATSFVNVPFLSAAKLAGVKGVICIWQGMSREMVRGQYLPFILSYQGIPCVWVCEEDGEKLIAAAKVKNKVTLTLDAKIEKRANSESFYTVLKGKNPNEAIIVNTHTDGVNCVEENGPIAMLAMMKYLKQCELERSVIFVFVTGHFRLPSFKQNDIQASSKWLKNHRDMWDGKNGHIKAVAGVAVEHLGATEWKDVDGVYQKTNDVDAELCYTGNKTMDDIYFRSLEGRTLVRTITLKGHNILHFGEGQPIRNVGIPQIGFVPAPDYLTAVSETHEMDKFNIDLMYEQIESFVKMVLLIDETPTNTLGSPEPYSFLIGSVK